MRALQRVIHTRRGAARRLRATLAVMLACCMLFQLVPSQGLRWALGQEDQEAADAQTSAENEGAGHESEPTSSTANEETEVDTAQPTTGASSEPDTLNVTLHFDANVPAGDSAPATGTMDDLRYAMDGTSYTLPACAFQRPGYDFAGWSTTPSGQDLPDDPATPNEDESMPAIAVANEQRVTDLAWQEQVPNDPSDPASSTHTEDKSLVPALRNKGLTLYAQWSPQASTKPDDTEPSSTQPSAAIANPVLDAQVTTAAGVTVVVHAPEGAFPAGTTLYVQDVDKNTALEALAAAGEQRPVDARAVDVTFMHNGEEVEPANGLKVQVTMRTRVAVAGNSHRVMHIADDGTVTQVAAATATEATFQADSFSVYVIDGDETLQRVKITYMNESNTLALASYIVREGSTLQAPSAMSTTPGYKLHHWYVGADATTGTDISSYLTGELTAERIASLANLGTQDQEDETLWTVVAHPHFTAAVRVILYANEYDEKKSYGENSTPDPVKTVAITDTINLTEAQDVDLSGVSIYLQPGWGIKGWELRGSDGMVQKQYLTTDTPSLTIPEADIAANMAGTAVDLRLWPVLTRGWRLDYVTGCSATLGGAFYESSPDTNGNQIAKVSVDEFNTRTRDVNDSSFNPGYDFEGWYLTRTPDPETGEYAYSDPIAPSDGNYTLTKDTVVYGKWEPGTSNFTVVYHVETAEGEAQSDNYTVYKTVTLSGTTDSQLDSKDFKDSKSKYFDSSLGSFHLKDPKEGYNDNWETITPDGLTVQHVYYERNWWNLYFVGSTATKNSNQGTTDWHVDTNLRDEKKINEYPIKVKWGERAENWFQKDSAQWNYINYYNGKKIYRRYAVYRRNLSRDELYKEPTGKVNDVSVSLSSAISWATPESFPFPDVGGNGDEYYPNESKLYVYYQCPISGTGSNITNIEIKTVGTTYHYTEIPNPEDWGSLDVEVNVAKGNPRAGYSLHPDGTYKGIYHYSFDDEKNDTEVMSISGDTPNASFHAYWSGARPYRTVGLGVGQNDMKQEELPSGYSTLDTYFDISQPFRYTLWYQNRYDSIDGFSNNNALGDGGTDGFFCVEYPNGVNKKTGRDASGVRQNTIRSYDACRYYTLTLSNLEGFDPDSEHNATYDVRKNMTSLSNATALLTTDNVGTKAFEQDESTSSIVGQVKYGLYLNHHEKEAANTVRVADLLDSFEGTQRTYEGLVYDFAGWYTTQRAALDLDTSNAYEYHNTTAGDGTVNRSTMPGYGVTAYAGWTIAKHNVTFVYNDGAGRAETSQVESGRRLNDPQPTREGYKLVGWYADEAMTELWDFSTPVTSDLVLRARWVKEAGYILEYYDYNGDRIYAPGDTDPTHFVEKDDIPYAFSARVALRQAPRASAQFGTEAIPFAGWSTKLNTETGAGDLSELIESNEAVLDDETTQYATPLEGSTVLNVIKLYATYRSEEEAEQKLSLRYLSNFQGSHSTNPPGYLRRRETGARERRCILAGQDSCRDQGLYRHGLYPCGMERGQYGQKRGVCSRHACGRGSEQGQDGRGGDPYQALCHMGAERLRNYARLRHYGRIEPYHAYAQGLRAV